MIILNGASNFLTTVLESDIKMVYFNVNEFTAKK